MKYLTLTIVVFCIAIANSQTTITSIADGLAANPSTWDCNCIPASNDEVIIDHNVEMNSDWIVNGNGSITVNTNASFIEDAQHRSIVFDGGSTFNNHGLSEFTNFIFMNGGVGHNYGTLSLDTAMWVGPGSTFMNHGEVKDIDSTYIQGMFMNEGTYRYGSFINEGTMDNTGYIQSDSLLNTGTINSSAGNIELIAFGNTGETNITGSSYMLIAGDFWNSGNFYLASGRDVRIGNSLANGNDADTALIINDGLFEVGNDFTNFDTIRGTGLFCIANSSSNTGDVKGTLDICDNTGVSHFDFNSGNIEPTVTNCSSGCMVALSENDKVDEFSIYPNPAKNALNIKSDENYSIQIIDVMGNILISQKVSPKIDISQFNTGVYFIVFSGEGRVITKKFIKE